MKLLVINKRQIMKQFKIQCHSWIQIVGKEEVLSEVPFLPWKRPRKFLASTVLSRRETQILSFNYNFFSKHPLLRVCIQHCERDEAVSRRHDLSIIHVDRNSFAADFIILIISSEMVDWIGTVTDGPTHSLNRQTAEVSTSWAKHSTILVSCLGPGLIVFRTFSASSTLSSKITFALFNAFIRRSKTFLHASLSHKRYELCAFQNNLSTPLYQKRKGHG